MDRTSEELQKKWADLKSTAKKDIAKYRREIKQTGGGSSLSPPYEVYERIIQIIGEQAVEGVKGGIDTAETTQPVINERGEGGSGKKFVGSQRRPEKKKEKKTTTTLLYKC